MYIEDCEVIVAFKGMDGIQEKADLARFQHTDYKL